MMSRLRFPTGMQVTVQVRRAAAAAVGPGSSAAGGGRGRCQWAAAVSSRLHDCAPQAASAGAALAQPDSDSEAAGPKIMMPYN